MAEEQRRQRRERLRVTETASRDAHLGDEEAKTEVGKKRAPNAEKVGNGDPAAVEHAHGSRGGGDPAPVQHAGGKFEAKDTFRSRKGDRFS